MLRTWARRKGLMALDVRRLIDLRLGFSHLRNTVDLEREYLQEVLDRGWGGAYGFAFVWGSCWWSDSSWASSFDGADGYERLPLG